MADEVDKDIEITREKEFSTYSWHASNVNDLQQFVSALYAVGAIGDEQVELKEWRVRVKIASDDLMPKAGEWPLRVRHAEMKRVRRTMLILKIAIVLLGVAMLVFFILWIGTATGWR